MTPADHFTLITQSDRVTLPAGNLSNAAAGERAAC
jgi:hypothetical protein